jgi:adenosine deaminase
VGLALASTFEKALVAGDVDALRACPKSDLHNHAMLGGDRQFLKRRLGREFEPLQRKLRSMAEMHSWVFEAIGDAFDGPEGRLLAFEATFTQAKNDGVSRLEIGDDVWAITLWDGAAARMTDALSHIHQSVAPEIEWLPQLGISRHCPVQAIEKWLAPFFDLETYKTIDLSGDENAQPIDLFKPIYRRAKKNGLRLKAHVGEWGSADDVWRAVEELELDEVQHGIAAASSPKVMRFLADAKIRLNICPTSNLMLGRVENLETHPIRRLYDEGVVVTINTDDALVFGCSVSEEFQALHDAGVFNAVELDEIRLNGLRDEVLPCLS